jgi:predicted alpha/beta hydrolase family esterase
MHSKDDPVVPFEHAGMFKKALPDAEVMAFEDREHFNQETFPEIIELIKKLK